MAKGYSGTPLPFPIAAREALADAQLRLNLKRATTTIRAKRAKVVAELDDWEQLRQAGHDIKMVTLADLQIHLERLEREFSKAGGQVHWARDGGEACQIVANIALANGITEVVKVKSLTTDEINLNEALAAVGVTAKETDLAELIVQLADEYPSHILVPAIHKNRDQIRDLFAAKIDEAPVGLTNSPRELAMTARSHLRRKFLSARMAVSGANFAIAESGTLCVVESEGNGRMCLTLPEILVSVVGIEKVLPTWNDLEVFMQLLPRSSTGERMNPYTSFWTGNGDGPSQRHLILLDNGRVQTLADETGREALACIRCSACMNVCPVYERTGGHSYRSVYPGPIGAIITPQLLGPGEAKTLPFASTLCGACYDVCPVKINIPKILVHLRARENQAAGSTVERWTMRASVVALMPRGLRATAIIVRVLTPLIRTSPMQRLLAHLPVARAWQKYRDIPAPRFIRRGSK
jgi:L-lactate dehydrogenase complex protein LldF